MRITAGWPRRAFLKAGAAAATMVAWPNRASAASRIPSMDGQWHDPDPPDDTALVAAALDAARAAGAMYTDVHSRRTQSEAWQYWDGTQFPIPSRSDDVGFGVRVLYNGYWGFAGLGGIATIDDVVRLARSATIRAKISSTGKPRIADLAPVPSVASGTWVMPVEIDPFLVSIEEKADYVSSVHEHFLQQREIVMTWAQMKFAKSDCVFGSSDGALTKQTIFTSGMQLNVSSRQDWLTEGAITRRLDMVTPAGAGWEYIRAAPFRDRTDQIVDELIRGRREKPVITGRYDVVFDANAMANILDATLGRATALDRAMGYRANDEGTSYLSDPLAMLGTQTIGSPHVTVTANRSMSGGAATVKWDDEGIEPQASTLVTKGVLTDFQTTREAASWIAPYYRSTNRAVRSNGCAGIYSTTRSVTQVSPNVVLEPGAQDLSFDDLVKDTKKGLAMIGGFSVSDQQALNGYGFGDLVFEIVDGKLGACVGGSQYLFRSPEFWKGVVAIGGRSSARPFGFERLQYERFDLPLAHTVSAVPAKVTNVAVVDRYRKS